MNNVVFLLNFCNDFNVKMWSLNICFRCGRCRLHGVHIRNKGVDWDGKSNVYWQHQVHRHEALEIILHGNAEFEAFDVVLEVR